MIFRNDDVTFNTDPKVLCDMYDLIKEAFPQAEIWSCVSVFAEKTELGSVYNDIPFKDKHKKWFYKAKEIAKPSWFPGRIVSHGLYHADHSKLDYDAQEMSIVGSCNYLDTKIFVPPFHRYNKETVDICNRNGIHLASLYRWRSLESNNADPNFRNWYFHSWRMTVEQLRQRLGIEMGQLQTNNV